MRPTIKSYRDLEIYQIAHKLAVEVHRMTIRELPKFEHFEEGSQVRRSSKSVSTNIVEGFGRRRYKGELLHFLTYAEASCDETVEHLLYLRDTESLSAQRSSYFLENYAMLAKMVNTFISGVQREHHT